MPNRRDFLRTAGIGAAGAYVVCRGGGAAAALQGQSPRRQVTIGGRRIMERLSPLTVNWTTLLISLVVQIPLLATDHRFLVDGASTVPVSGWIAMIYLIVFATALGQQAWLYGVKGVGPSRAGVFVNLIPVSALSLSALVLGEPIGGKELVGIVLILAGVWLVGRQSARVKPTARQKPA